MATIAEQLAHLSRALDLADGRFNPTVIEAGRSVISSVGERVTFTTPTTVAALFGATGSGKSSLINALTDTEHARVAHTRPTTRNPLAIARELDPDNVALLNWLEVDQRALSKTLSEDLVLVDLPDVDSVERHHRELSEKMAKVVDVLVWVLDPQKYADAVLHHEFLAPLARHAEVTLVVLNQIDRVDQAELPSVMRDVKRLLAADGLKNVTVTATSAVTGQGVKELRAQLEQIAHRQEAMRVKSRAEIEHIASQLMSESGRGELTLADREPVVKAAAKAAGMDALSSAVAKSYRRRASMKAGWPFIRWVNRLRPDPLPRLHLATGGGNIERAEITPTTSLPEPSPVQAAQVRATAHDFVLASGKGLPEQWRSELVADNQARIPALTDSLDEALARIELPVQPARWWTIAGIMQLLASAAVLVGGGWLAAMALGAYLQFEIAAPTWRGFPIPTLILLAGLAAGILTAIIGRWAAAVGARRRAARTRALIMKAVDARVERQLIAPVKEQLDDYELFVDSARRARDRR
ncbi:hypothetical protein BSZ39_09035 [Bowdeniella nasicola]|uniref:G domain-containing protein n=1 Tax=Bowdeniella nasicola TaxID=208480 RepID=A0A1Q5Q1P2_9ACTO|nr:GTPase [Bowdeniella nasicola]OKL53520.1 hypothetical protein BSZ39_09035 [Bowdeniella nasicola]